VFVLEKLVDVLSVLVSVWSSVRIESPTNRCMLTSIVLGFSKTPLEMTVDQSDMTLCTRASWDDFKEVCFRTSGWDWCAGTAAQRV
jgi:hypothetical protein